MCRKYYPLPLPPKSRLMRPQRNPSPQNSLQTRPSWRLRLPAASSRACSRRLQPLWENQRSIFPRPLPSRCRVRRLRRLRLPEASSRAYFKQLRPLWANLRSMPRRLRSRLPLNLGLLSLLQGNSHDSSNRRQRHLCRRCQIKRKRRANSRVCLVEADGPRLPRQPAPDCLNLRLLPVRV